MEASRRAGATAAAASARGRPRATDALYGTQPGGASLGSATSATQGTLRDEMYPPTIEDEGAALEWRSDHEAPVSQVLHLPPPLAPLVIENNSPNPARTNGATRPLTGSSSSSSSTSLAPPPPPPYPPPFAPPNLELSPAAPTQHSLAAPTQLAPTQPHAQAHPPPLALAATPQPAPTTTARAAPSHINTGSVQRLVADLTPKIRRAWTWAQEAAPNSPEFRSRPSQEERVRASFLKALEHVRPVGPGGHTEHALLQFAPYVTVSGGLQEVDEYTRLRDTALGGRVHSEARRRERRRGAAHTAAAGAAAGAAVGARAEGGDGASDDDDDAAATDTSTTIRPALVAAALVSDFVLTAVNAGPNLPDEVLEGLIVVLLRHADNMFDIKGAPIQLLMRLAMRGVLLLGEALSLGIIGRARGHQGPVTYDALVFDSAGRRVTRLPTSQSRLFALAEELSDGDAYVRELLALELTAPEDVAGANFKFGGFDVVVRRVQTGQHLVALLMVMGLGYVFNTMVRREEPRGEARRREGSFRARVELLAGAAEDLVRAEGVQLDFLFNTLGSWEPVTWCLSAVFYGAYRLDRKLARLGALLTMDDRLAEARKHLDTDAHSGLGEGHTQHGVRTNLFQHYVAVKEWLDPALEVLRRSTARVSLHDVAHIVRRNGQQPTTAAPAQQPAPPPPQSAVDLIRAIQARKRAREDPPGADGAAPATAAV